MIKSIKDKLRSNCLEIDLTGPNGNAHYLLNAARLLCRRLGHNKFRTDCILEEMMLTDYEGLLYTFDREFGSLVTLWR